MSRTAPTAMQQLVSSLDLEKLEQDLFRGTSPQVGWQRVFGGQVIGQALVAAQRTVAAERPVHSLHGYFMRPGDPSAPIVYEVDRIRDGLSFATRSVVAIQHGKAIFSLSASFQKEEDGLEYQSEIPAVTPPEDLPGKEEMREAFLAGAPDHIRDYWERERPIEVRPLSLEHYISDRKSQKAEAASVLDPGATGRPDVARMTGSFLRRDLAYLSDIRRVGTRCLCIVRPWLLLCGVDDATSQVLAERCDTRIVVSPPSQAGTTGLILLYGMDSPNKQWRAQAVLPGGVFYFITARRQDWIASVRSQEGFDR